MKVGDLELLREYMEAGDLDIVLELMRKLL